MVFQCSQEEQCTDRGQSMPGLLGAEVKGMCLGIEGEARQTGVGEPAMGEGASPCGHVAAGEVSRVNSKKSSLTSHSQQWDGMEWEITNPQAEDRLRLRAFRQPVCGQKK
eukprot:GGOE01008505.1.p8 GENE.GGOE01008505.1~~GGOE01008505.1.p8  ORF type:complete len:110 (+),score=5.51 GGOE01008505.1:1883-2212(+)